MRTIIPNQLFKHGTETYEAGKSYEVSDEDAHYFEMVGWAGPEAAGGNDHTLDIHDGQLGHKSEVK